MECWICLSGDDAKLGPLHSSCCRCSPGVRPVHAKCLGRWQLQRAGTREETHCRFCNSKYQLDWRTSLSGPGSQVVSDARNQAEAATDQAPSLRPPTPIMAIIFEGKVHRIKVHPGPEGKARFQQQIRELVQLGDDEEFEVEFECKAPGSGAVLHLDGMGAFDAATHCASLTAAERQKRENTTQTSSSNSSHSDVHMQQEQEQQQQFSSRGHSRAGGVASVQLQVSSHHSTAHSCPRSTVQQDTAMVPRPSVHQAL